MGEGRDDQVFYYLSSSDIIGVSIAQNSSSITVASEFQSITLQLLSIHHVSGTVLSLGDTKIVKRQSLLPRGSR